MQTVEQYITAFPIAVQEILNTIRTIIKKQSPNIVESIAYGMPAYKLNKKPLVYFAAYKNHVGFYATPNGHNQFSTELASFKQGKGSVQFQLNEPIPFELIERIVRFRVGENETK